MARRDHPNNTWCPQCGYGISVDEEGCCISCGGDAMGEGVDAAVALLHTADHTEAFRVRLVAVEELIEEAHQDKSAFDEGAGRGSGVNWGDLRAVDVEHWVRDDGDSGYRVYVEEVSPTAEKLPAFLQAGLADRGIENTAIVCKW